MLVHHGPRIESSERDVERSQVAMYFHTFYVWGRRTYVGRPLYYLLPSIICLTIRQTLTKASSRSGDPANVYQRFDPIELEKFTQTFCSPFSYFFQRVKNATVCLDFRHQSPLTHSGSIISEISNIDVKLQWLSADDCPMCPPNWSILVHGALRNQRWDIAASSTNDPL